MPSQVGSMDIDVMQSAIRDLGNFAQLHCGDENSIGGGLAIVHHDNITVCSSRDWHGAVTSFEFQAVTFGGLETPLTIANIYRPPSSNMNTFAEEFSNLRFACDASACARYIIQL